MPLIRHRVTPAKLAANRANARKSTGPRTHRGKGAVRLNALRHGFYASPKFFRTYMAGAREDVALYDWIYSQVCHVLRPSTGYRWVEAERVSRGTWCRFRMLRLVGLRRGWKAPRSSSMWCRLRVPLSRASGDVGTKPIYGVKSIDSHVMFRMSHRIEIGEAGIYLAFWTRRKRRRPRVPVQPPRPAPQGGWGALLKRFVAKIWNPIARWRARKPRNIDLPSSRAYVGWLSSAFHNYGHESL
jgi:hypothetical protein